MRKPPDQILNEKQLSGPADKSQGQWRFPVGSKGVKGGPRGSKGVKVKSGRAKGRVRSIQDAEEDEDGPEFGEGGTSGRKTESGPRASTQRRLLLLTSILFALGILYSGTSLVREVTSLKPLEDSSTTSSHGRASQGSGNASASSGTPQRTLQQKEKQDAAPSLAGSDSHSSILSGTSNLLSSKRNPGTTSSSSSSRRSGSSAEASMSRLQRSLQVMQPSSTPQHPSSRSSSTGGGSSSSRSNSGNTIEGKVLETVPVVHFYFRHATYRCPSSHYMVPSLRSARKANSLVYLISPVACSAWAKDLGIIVEPLSEYDDVTNWFQQELGKPVGYQVRWYVLKVFMERHNFSRIFYCDGDVLLFGNVTHLGSTVYKDIPILLSARWPSLRLLSPSQYPSTAVSGHVSMWTLDALKDFLDFFYIFFKKAVLYGQPGDKTLVEERNYNDMVPLGWYTYAECWVKRPEELHPECIADRVSGITRERSARIRGSFTPKYLVRSLQQPIWCENTEWSDEGWCVFDNNFNLKGKRMFKFQPEKGMKLPTSMHYVHFDDWSRNQTQPVQFLAVHFQGKKKRMLESRKEASLMWGSAPD